MRALSSFDNSDGSQSICRRPSARSPVNASGGGQGNDGTKARAHSAVVEKLPGFAAMNTSRLAIESAELDNVRAA
jgi:hypothetical protein